MWRAKPAPLPGVLLFHVIGELGKFFRCHPRSFAGVVADGGHNFVVEVSDELLPFLLHALGRFAKSTIQFASKVFERRFFRRHTYSSSFPARFASAPLSGADADTPQGIASDEPRNGQRC